MKTIIYNDNRLQMIARHNQVPFQTHLDPNQCRGRVDPRDLLPHTPSGVTTRSNQWYFNERGKVKGVK